MKLNEFVKMHKNFTKGMKTLNEESMENFDVEKFTQDLDDADAIASGEGMTFTPEETTTRCFSQTGHKVTFNDAATLLFDYLGQKDLANFATMAIRDEDNKCNQDLVAAIKIAQEDLGVKDDGIMGRNTIGALRKATLDPDFVNDTDKPFTPFGDEIDKEMKPSKSLDTLAVGDSIATEIMVAGDSVAVGLKNAGAKSVQGATIGGTHTWQILRNLGSKLPALQEQKSKKILYVSAGVNDALAYAITSGAKRATQNGLPRGMPSQPFFTPEITSKEIDKIATLAKSKGYDIKFRLVGPAPFKGNTNSGMGTIDPSRFNEFSQKVNSHMASRGYSTFATNVAMRSDGIHPTRGGYISLFSSINSGAASSVSSNTVKKTTKKTKPITSTEKDNLIVVGDSNANYIAKKWYGIFNSSTNIQRPNFPNKIYYLVDRKTNTLLAPQISGGQVSHILAATKEFYELKGENYKPTTAIVHMGYNGSSDGQLKAFKETISFLKSKGVSDIRVIEVKVDTTKMSSDTFRKTMTDRAARVNNLIRSLSGITIIPNQGDNRNDGYHFTQGGYQAIYGAAMSGTSAPVAKDKIKVKPRGTAVEVASKGFPDFISEKSRGSTIRILSSFGSFSEVMDSVTQIFKAAAAKVNLQVSENPTIEDLKNLQSKLGLDNDGSFGPTSMAAISLINSKYASGVVSESLSNAINLKSHLVKSFRGLMEQSLNNLLQEGSKFGTIDVDIYVDQYASASVLRKAYRGAVSKGLSVNKPPMSNKYSKKDTSWREDKEFLRKVKAYSDLNSVDPKMFLAFIAHETAGTFSPYMENHIGCTGLIQFCPGENAGMASISMNGAQLKAMTRSEQWDQVEIFYNKNKHKGWHKGGGDIATLYMITFSPAFADFGDDDVIYSKDPKRADPRVKKLMKNSTITKRWKQNPANRNPDDKDIITKAGLRKKLLPNYSKYKITDKLFEV